jgi:Ca2+-binding RTX toxin-like protein
LPLSSKDPNFFPEGTNLNTDQRLQAINDDYSAKTDQLPQQLSNESFQAEAQADSTAFSDDPATSASTQEYSEVLAQEEVTAAQAPPGSGEQGVVDQYISDISDIQTPGDKSFFGDDISPSSGAGEALTGLEGVATALDAVGRAAIALDALNTAYNAEQQVAAGDYSGAATTVTDFGGRLEGGLAGAELGAEVGAEVGSLFGPVGAAAGGLIGGLAGGVAGAAAGEAFVQSFTDALSTAAELLTAGDTGDGDDGSGANPSDEDSPNGSDPATPPAGDGAPGAAGEDLSTGNTYASPLVLDLTGQGFNLTPLSYVSPYFDLSGTGFAHKTGWIGAGTGLLCLPTNTDQVTSGLQLFGTAGGATNGFAALSAYDTNHDGVINAKDPIFNQLRIWVDSNGNGKADSGELLTLAQLNIVSISLNATAVSENLNGNTVSLISSYTLANGTTFAIGDAWFNNSPTYTQPDIQVAIPTTIAALPQVNGSGTLASLQSTMVSDQTLQTLVQTLVGEVSSATPQTLQSAVQAIMFEWSGSASINPTSDGVAYDAREVDFIQKYTGVAFDKAGYIGDPAGPFDNPVSHWRSGIAVTQAWISAFDSTEARLLLQAGYALPEFRYNAALDFVLPTQNLFASIASLFTRLGNPSTQNIGQWKIALQVADAFRLDAHLEPGVYLDTVAASSSDSIAALASAIISGESYTVGANGAISLTGVTTDSTLYAGSSVPLIQITGLYSLNPPSLDDTVVYNRGDGTLDLNITDYANSTNNILQLGNGILPSELRVTADGSGNLYLSDGTAGDQIKIDNMFNTHNIMYGVQQVEFADGTTLTPAELILQEMTGTTGADKLYGTSGANVLDGKGAPAASQDYEQGYGGNDTFVYNPCYGQLEISEYDSSASDTNILKLGSGITPSQVTVTSDGFNLYLTEGITGDKITLDDELYSAPYGVQEVLFANGATLTRAQLIALELAGTTGADKLYGTSGPDVFDGKGASAGFQDYESGDAGGDTFVYNRGYGQLEISEYDPSAGNTNILKLGSGITPSQVTVTSDGFNLYLTDGVTNDKITLDDELYSAPYGVQEVLFANGATLTRAQLIALELAGTTGADKLYGTSGPDVFDGKGAPAGSQDYESGDGGNDTFVYNPGYGQLEISEFAYSASDANILKLGSGITSSQVTITSDGFNLYLTDAVTGDKITLDDEFYSASYGVEEITFSDGTIWSQTNPGSTLLPLLLQNNSTTFSIQDGYLFELTGSSNKVSVTGSSSVSVTGNSNLVSAANALANYPNTLTASGNSNTLVAGPGGGVITATGSLDVLKAGSGYTIMTASGNQNTLQGGAGVDTLTVTGSSNVLTAGGGYEQLYVNGASNTVQTGASNTDLTIAGNSNHFTGGSNDARVIIAGSNNVLAGGSVETTYTVQSGSGNTYEAGTGYAILDYSGDPTAVNVNLTAGTASLTGSSSLDTLEGIQEVHVGSNSSITAGSNSVNLYISGTASTLRGGSGYDNLSAAGNSDTLIVGSGGGSLSASGNLDLLEGGAAYAVLSANGSQNTLQGGSGTNTLIVSGGSNILTAGGGYEEINVTGNQNSIQGGAGVITTTLSGNSNHFTGGTNYASIAVAGSGNVIANGNNVTDITVKSGSGNTYGAGTGYVILDYTGDPTAVSVNLATGAASFTGSSSTDTLQNITEVHVGSNSSVLAGSLAATLFIVGNNSTLRGGSGFDNLLATGNYDTLVASSGGDSLTASGSFNLLEGGAAYTVLTVNGNQNTLQGGSGTNTLVVNGGSNILTAGGGFEQITITGNQNTLQASTGVADVTLSGNNNHFTGGSGFDDVIISGSNNVLTGGNNDVDYQVQSGSGNTFSPGTGSALLDYSADPTAVSVNLTAGTASFAGNGGVDTLQGITQVNIGANSSVVAGSAGANLSTSGNGSTLQGGSGGANLTASGNNDTLTAGTGGGTLSASGTSDLYVLGANDYNVVIQNGSGGSTASNQLTFLASATTEQLWFTKSGSNLQIEVLDNAHTVTIDNWFSSAGSQLQEINSSNGWKLDSGVTQLVQAMATYTSANPSFHAATATVMPTNTTLQNAITAAWHH